MTNWKKLGRRILSKIVLWAPMRSYGELVLRPVTIAERAAGMEVAFSYAKIDKK